jgi:hypothetical protein
MKVGQGDVRFFEADGTRHVSEVVEITGTGKSLAKILTLQYRSGGENVVVEDVKHEQDSEPGEPFWLRKGERRSREDIEAAASVDDSPVLDTTVPNDTEAPSDATGASEIVQTSGRRRSDPK